jgi:hydroxyethylthiazole kinase
MIPETEILVQALIKVRQQKPVVHAITNSITANEVATALHAIGARPIMAFAPEEVKEITSKADALVLNLGTPTPDRIEAMILAGRQANAQNHPVIFDPVGAGASRFRIDSSTRILSEVRVTIIRGNQAEIGFLAGTGGHLAGIDAVRGPEDLYRAGDLLSRKTGAVVVASGPQDWVVAAGRKAIVENGHPMMGQVTGMGCMLTAVMGAFAAVEKDPIVAAVSALTFFGLAGEQTALRTDGPGTFKSVFLDTLFSLTPDQMRKGIRLKD